VSQRALIPIFVDQEVNLVTVGLQKTHKRLDAERVETRDGNRWGSSARDRSSVYEMEPDLRSRTVKWLHQDVLQ
jgi:hypothetical protein